MPPVNQFLSSTLSTCWPTPRLSSQANTGCPDHSTFAKTKKHSGEGCMREYESYLLRYNAALLKFAKRKSFESLLLAYPFLHNGL